MVPSFWRSEPVREGVDPPTGFCAVNLTVLISTSAIMPDIASAIDLPHVRIRASEPGPLIDVPNFCDSATCSGRGRARSEGLLRGDGPGCDLGGSPAAHGGIDLHLRLRSHRWLAQRRRAPGRGCPRSGGRKSGFLAGNGGAQATGAKLRRCHLRTLPSRSAGSASRTSSPTTRTTDELQGGDRRPHPAPTRQWPAGSGDVLGTQGRGFRDPPRRGDRDYRPQRCRQEHAPENPLADHLADDR